MKKKTASGECEGVSFRISDNFEFVIKTADVNGDDSEDEERFFSYAEMRDWIIERRNKIAASKRSKLSIDALRTYHSDSEFTTVKITGVRFGSDSITSTPKPSSGFHRYYPNVKTVRDLAEIVSRLKRDLECAERAMEEYEIKCVEVAGYGRKRYDNISHDDLVKSVIESDAKARRRAESHTAEQEIEIAKSKPPKKIRF